MFSQSVAQSCLTPCNPMNRSTPGLPVPHHLPKFAQVHVHCISDPIQPSHPLMPSCASTLNLSQHQELFQWVNCSHQMTKILELQLHHQLFQWFGCSHQVTKILELQHQPFQWVIQGWFSLRLTGFISLQSKGISGVLQHHSAEASILKHSGLLYDPALTTVHDHWEDHSLDYMDLYLPPVNTFYCELVYVLNIW